MIKVYASRHSVFSELSYSNDFDFRHVMTDDSVAAESTVCGVPYPGIGIGSGRNSVTVDCSQSWKCQLYCGTVIRPSSSSSQVVVK